MKKTVLVVGLMAALLALPLWAGATPLIDQARALVEAGKDLNAQDGKKGGPFLFYKALRLKDYAAAQYMLDSGLDIELDGDGSMTPLAYALFFAKGCDGVSDKCTDQMNRVRWLIDRGADPGLKNQFGTVLYTYNTKKGINWPLEAWVAERDALLAAKTAAATPPEPIAPPEPVLTAAEKAAIARQVKIDKQLERDEALPVEVRRDKYMIALTGHLKNERYDRALDYFQLLERTGGERPPGILFYHGEAFLRTGQPEQAMAKLYAYVAAAGREGQHYTRALELINEAEAQ